MTALPPCILCHGPLSPGPRVRTGIPDFGGSYGRGQTLSYVPVIGRGPFAHCNGPCKITYRVRTG